MEVVTTYGYDTYRASEFHTLLMPRKYNMSKRRMGIVMAHGAGGNAQTVHRVTSYGEYRIAHLLAHAGFPVAYADLGGQFTWGNDTAVAAIEDLRIFLQQWAKPGPIGITGCSMGGLNPLAYYRAHPGNVACIYTGIPVTDLQDIVVNDRGGYRASANAAHGRAAGDVSALPAGVSPAQSPNNYLNLSWRTWYASDDPICIASAIQNFAAAIGKPARNAGPLGHTDAAILSEPVEDIYEFMRQNEV